MSNRLTFSLASLFLIFAFALLIPGTAEADDVTLAAQSDLPWVAGTIVTAFQLPEGTHNDADGQPETMTYSLKPALPAGVSVNLATRQVTGLPTTGMKSTEYTWTATASSGHKNSVTFNISVASAPKFPAAKLGDVLVKSGKAVNIAFSEATDADGGVPTYAIDPALPTGLTFLNAPPVLQISGAVTADTVTGLTENEVTYTLTATGDTTLAGSPNTDTVTVKITYEVDLKPNFPTGAKVDPINYTLGQDDPFSNVQLPRVAAANMNTGGTIRYDLTPNDLPAGLSLLPDVWVITGTPTAAMAETEYTWSATDEDGDKSDPVVKFKVTINAAPVPVAFAPGASIPNQTFEVGTLREVILPPKASNTGTGDVSYSLTPDPPAGLSFNPTSRVLGGTATAGRGIS